MLHGVPALQVREVGGAMSSMWSGYLQHARSVIVRTPSRSLAPSLPTSSPSHDGAQIVLDASVPSLTGLGIAQALKVLSHPAVAAACTPCCVVLNKSDAPGAMGEVAAGDLLRLGDFTRPPPSTAAASGCSDDPPVVTHDITLMPASALTGVGVKGVQAWVQDKLEVAPAQGEPKD